MDVTANKKKIKNEKNEKDKSVEKLRSLFLKTEEMREISESRNRQMENQFEELQQRLSTTSVFLNRIRRNIEEIKLRNFETVTEQVTEENRHEIDREIAELREKVDKIKSKQMERVVPKNYEEAFSQVLAAFREIERKN